MKGEVKWTGDGGYVGTTSRGKVFGIYGETSPSPMEMVLHAHAACSLIDVIEGLKERKENIDYVTVEIEAQRADDKPKVFTAVNMNYIMRGDVPEKLVRRLIESSHERYCSVGIMITRSGATLDWTLEMAD
ncbi:OsmC family protein [Euryarchaeota archaeon]|nr:OsmC family protein [Euryarchaeota archaeon]|tara:strand:+ start:462 stop:854 length:393 start_codon:yes stop_codon:yes gene_type:complete